MVHYVQVLLKVLILRKQKLFKLLERSFMCWSPGSDPSYLDSPFHQVAYWDWFLGFKDRIAPHTDEWDIQTKKITYLYNLHNSPIKHLFLLPSFYVWENYITGLRLHSWKWVMIFELSILDLEFKLSLSCLLYPIIIVL